MKKSGIHIKPKNRGKLHKNLGIALDKPIPEHKILSAMKFAGPAEKKRLVFAENAKHWNHKK